MFTSRLKTRIVLLLIGLLPAGVFAQQNTILIVADDVSPDYLGCYSSVTDTAPMPVIRSLADQGVRFTKAWSAPVCSPARAAMLSGRYPFRTGVGGVISSATSPQIDTAEISIARMLKFQAPVSYQTACIGKWHLNANTPLRRRYPNKLGFDLYSGNFNGAIPDYYQYVRVKNGIIDTVNTYATTQTVNDALAWLDTINPAQPFFLWLAFNAPHDPYHLPPAALCDTSGLPGTAADIAARPEAYFKAALQAMDTEIGRLLNYLDVHGLRDSTNIIFVGDNGNAREVAQSMNPMKSKGTIYNYGVQVPMIVSGPSVMNVPRSSAELVSTVDLLASIAELSGFSNWSSVIPSGISMDSRSFVPILKNQTGAMRSWIFSETFNVPATPADGKTIRNETYHLLRFDNGVEEFYNQTNDPEENTNLLLNTSAMTAVEWFNYQWLCDSIAALTGITPCLSVSVTSLVVQSDILLSPNPTGGTLNIEFPLSLNTEKINVSVCNLYGQIVQQASVDAPQGTLDLSSLAPGVYCVRIDCGAMRGVRLIVKD